MRVGDVGKDAQVVAERAGLGGARVQTAAGAAIGEMSHLDAAVARAFEVLKLIFSNALVHLGDESAFDPLHVVRLTARRAVIVVARRARPVTGGEVWVTAEIQVSAIRASGANNVSERKRDAWLDELCLRGEFGDLNHLERVSSEQRHRTLDASVERQHGNHRSHKRQRWRATKLLGQVCARWRRELVLGRRARTGESEDSLDILCVTQQFRPEVRFELLLQPNHLVFFQAIQVARVVTKARGRWWFLLHRSSDVRIRVLFVRIVAVAHSAVLHGRAPVQWTVAFLLVVLPRQQ